MARGGTGSRYLHPKIQTSAHSAPCDEVCTAGGWDIQFIHQPLNSPNLNMLDLVFLNSIQLLSDGPKTTTTDSLIAKVWRAFGSDYSLMSSAGRVRTTFISGCRITGSVRGKHAQDAAPAQGHPDGDYGYSPPAYVAVQFVA